MNEISRIAASALISSTWQTIVLAAVVALCLQLIPRISAAVRYTVWTAVLAVFVLLPLLSLHHATVDTIAPIHTPALHLDTRWSLALAALWATLSLVRGLQLAASAIRIRSIAKRATPIPGHLPCTTTGTTRTAILCTSDDVARPSVLGFFSPRILIPTWLFARITPAELDHIVLHEMQHLRRRDDWINLLQKIGLILFPLNPALLWVERRLCLERELACDDGVLEVTHAPKAYASCLVNLAERQVTRSRLSLALGAWERRSELARRVHAILKLRGEAMRRGPANALAATLILALTGGAAALSRSPQFVSFADTSTPSLSAGTTPISSAPYQAVSFRPSDQQPHMTLLKAVMPSPSGSQPTHKPRRRVQMPKQLTAQTPATEFDPMKPAPAPNRVTLTSLSDSAQTPSPAPAQTGPQIIFTVIQGPQSSHSYAAVSTPNGWIVFQL